MRILVLGAGGTGGYFGGRLAQSGADVTFLVRPARAEFLRQNGLVIQTPQGTDKIPVNVVTADRLTETYDLILISCKAYDLDSSIEAIRPAVGPETLIAPFLNGLQHMEVLDRAFGAEKILGGLVYIFASLKPTGEVVRMDDMHIMTLGARQKLQAEACEEIKEVFSKAAFDFRLSDDIMQDMWEKFVFLSSLASNTCLFRGSLGDIVASAYGRETVIGIHAECRSVAAASGHPVRAAAVEKGLAMLTEVGSKRTASMMRDLEAGGKIEADAIVGDMVRRGEALGVDVPLMKAVYTHLQVYQTRFGK